MADSAVWMAVTASGIAEAAMAAAGPVPFCRAWTAANTAGVDTASAALRSATVRGERVLEVVMRVSRVSTAAR